LLIAFTLLITAMSVATPLVVRHARLLKSQRDYRLALDELSNQLDVLCALPAGDLPRAIEAITLSDFAAQYLRGTTLTGDLQPAESGTRITLTLSWKDANPPRAPVSLAAWVFPTGSQSDSDTGEAESP
jgi:hypothetical protein